MECSRCHLVGDGAGFGQRLAGDGVGDVKRAGRGFGVGVAHRPVDGLADGGEQRVAEHHVPTPGTVHDETLSPRLGPTSPAVGERLGELRLPELEAQDVAFRSEDVEPVEHLGGQLVGGSRVRVDELAAHLASWQAGESGLIFTNDQGEPISRTRFSEVWRRAVATAELEGAKFHNLRHFYASLLIRHGESVKVVQSRLGHASAAETLDTYSHLWPDSEDQTRAAVDSVLGAGDSLRTAEAT